MARRRAPKGQYLAHPSDLEGRVPNAPTLAGLPGCFALLLPAAGQRFEDVFAHAMWLKTWFGPERCALALPLLLWARRDLFGLITPSTGTVGVLGLNGYWHDLGLLWLALGTGGVLLRTLQLCFLRGPVWGLAWMCKILTDPLHNIDIYWRSPIALLQGQRYEPIDPAAAH